MHSVQQQGQGAEMPSLNRFAGTDQDNVLALAGNVAGIVGIALTAPAALGTTLGLMAPVLSIAAQAILLKDDLQAGGADLGNAITELSAPAVLLQAAAIYTFVMMGSLGVFAGLALTAVMGGATYAAALHEDGAYAATVMQTINTKLAEFFPAQPDPV